MTPRPPAIVVLSNIFDPHYHDVRGEKIAICMTTACRRDLFLCLEMASGRELILLSSPPKAAERCKGRWLPAVETKFVTFRQFFCANWDIPKLRIPLSWFLYARHVVRHVRSGDLVVIDNYEFIYIVAAWVLKTFRRVTFILAYLDGKHLIDHGWDRVLSGLAEIGGRPLLNGAVLSTPSLRERLPDSLPKEVVPGPGFVSKELPSKPSVPDKEVRFLYAGALDRTRGVDLLLESLEYLPEYGWHLVIAGQGPLTEHIIRFTQDPRWRGKVEYHQPLPPTTDAFKQMVAASHVGLNCQRTSDPISNMTFPTKIFTYLSAGLLVISSKASSVAPVCGNACLYYEEETPQSLAAAMKEVMANFSVVRRKLDPTGVSNQYSIEATAGRMRRLFQAAGVAGDR